MSYAYACDECRRALYIGEEYGAGWLQVGIMDAPEPVRGPFMTPRHFCSAWCASRWLGRLDDVLGLPVLPAEAETAGQNNGRRQMWADDPIEEPVQRFAAERERVAAQQARATAQRDNAHHDRDAARSPRGGGRSWSAPYPQREPRAGAARAESADTPPAKDAERLRAPEAASPGSESAPDNESRQLRLKDLLVGAPTVDLNKMAFAGQRPRRRLRRTRPQSTGEGGASS